MRAVVVRAFGEPPAVEVVPDPAISLPHVPGHELAGEVAQVGPEVRGFAVGDRVTVPFCCGCGTCEPCRQGWTQICDADFQPGFTAPGSFAELVALPRADLNLVRLPESLGFVEAASLGCRFMTAFAALTDVAAGDWVAVHGCGGVGLSAVMIAHALGASVVAVDIDDDTLELARSLGAAHAVDAREHDPDGPRDRLRALAGRDGFVRPAGRDRHRALMWAPAPRTGPAPHVQSSAQYAAVPTIGHSRSGSAR
jgi:D-arabinose 1-dehydrogenase-like Zn-dependent alcohol dehydrogenase